MYYRSGNRIGRTLKILAELKFMKGYHRSKGILDWQAQHLAPAPAF